MLILRIRKVKKIICVVIVLVLTLPVLTTTSDASPHYSGAPNISSRAAVLIDADTGQVLFGQNGQARMYPASLTKIMTAWLASEMAHPDEVMTASGSAMISFRNSANIGMRAGEQIRVGDALFAIMLPSANEVSNVLAEHIAGSQPAFADLMTERAHSIGAVNTRFENAHGLHGRGHYTTANDMAHIIRHAARNESFMLYFGAGRHTMPATNLHQQRSFTNFHRMLVSGTSYYDSSVIGGKTGFTNPARHTLGTIARRGGRTLVAVVMHAGTASEARQDTQALLSYGFNSFTTVALGVSPSETIIIPAMQNGITVGDVTFAVPANVTVAIPNWANPDDLQVRLLHYNHHEVTSGRPFGQVVIELNRGQSPANHILTVNMSFDFRVGTSVETVGFGAFNSGDSSTFFGQDRPSAFF